MPLVTSSRENCLGSECPQFKGCHVNKARRDAMAADLVVVNHHLFFADLALRDSGVAELLPSVEVAVFDEAHQLGEAGVQFLGTILGSSQLIDFARDMLAVGLQQARGLAAVARARLGLRPERARPAPGRRRPARRGSRRASSCAGPSAAATRPSSPACSRSARPAKRPVRRSRR